MTSLNRWAFTLCCTLAFADLATASNADTDSDADFRDVAAQLKLLHSDEPEVAEQAAQRLIQLATDADKERFAFKEAKWMTEVFMESTDMKHRKQAFRLLFDHARGELQGLTKTIEITRPICGCIGRFHGSVQHVLHSKFDEVWMVALSQGKVPKKEAHSLPPSLWEPAGPPAVLRLHIYASTEIEEEDILRALYDSRYFDMKHWTVSVQKPVLEFIGKK